MWSITPSYTWYPSISSNIGMHLGIILRLPMARQIRLWRSFSCSERDNHSLCSNARMPPLPFNGKKSNILSQIERLVHALWTDVKDTPWYRARDLNPSFAFCSSVRFLRRFLSYKFLPILLVSMVLSSLRRRSFSSSIKTYSVNDSFGLFDSNSLIFEYSWEEASGDFPLLTIDLIRSHLALLPLFNGFMISMISSTVYLRCINARRADFFPAIARLGVLIEKWLDVHQRTNKEISAAKYAANMRSCHERNTPRSTPAVWWEQRAAAPGWRPLPAKECRLFPSRFFGDKTREQSDERNQYNTTFLRKYLCDFFQKCESFLNKWLEMSGNKLSTAHESR